KYAQSKTQEDQGRSSKEAPIRFARFSGNGRRSTASHKIPEIRENLHTRGSRQRCEVHSNWRGETLRNQWGRQRGGGGEAGARGLFWRGMHGRAADQYG